MAEPGGIRAGKAFVELSAQDKVTKVLDSVEKRIQRMGDGITSVGKKMLGIGLGIAAAFVPTIMAASDLQETMSKFDTVFGDRANAVKQWADETASALGRSKKDIAGFVASLQDLFVPLGFSADEAETLSKQVTQLGIDLASFNNMADEDTLRDLQAALTGSGEVMKKYGVIVSEAAVKQELLNRGLNPAAATETQKVSARLAIIMRGTTAAQGDAMRTAGGFANQLKRLKGEIFDTAAAIGNNLLPIATLMVSLVGRLVNGIGQWAAANKGLFVAIAGIAIALTAGGSALLTLGLVFKAAALAVSGLSMAIALLANPIVLAIAAVAGLGAYLLATTENGQRLLGWLGEKFFALWETAKTAFGGIADALKAGDISLAMQILWAGLKLLWAQGTQSIKEKWTQFVYGLLDAWTIASSFLEGLFHQTTAAFVNAWHSAVEEVTKLFDFMERKEREKEKDRIRRDQAAGKLTQAQADRQIANVDSQANQVLAARQANDDAARVAREAELKKKLDDIKKKRDAQLEANVTAEQGDIAALDEEKKKLQAELDALRKKAKDKREAKDEAGRPTLVDPTLVDPNKLRDLNAAKDRTSSIKSQGTFNASALQSLITSPSQEAIKKATEQTASNTKRIADEMRNMNRFV